MQSLCAMDHVDYNLTHPNQYDSLLAVIRCLKLPEDALTEAFHRMAFNFLAMNCDDHAKNFAFLIDENGNWSLAPAFDVTYAHDSKNMWLRERLMGINGKFSSISVQDIMRFADYHGIPYARKALGEVKYALTIWADFAKQAGLSESIQNGAAPTTHMTSYTTPATHMRGYVKVVFQKSLFCYATFKPLSFVNGV